MQKSAIILESSYLASNIYKTILRSENCHVDLALHFEDIDVLMRERRYDVIVIGSSLFSNEKWTAILSRNPLLKEICKIFIGSGKAEPSDFIQLKRPFNPNQLIDVTGLQAPPKALSNYDDKTKDGAEPQGNRRIFERKPHRLNVNLNDEKGEPIISLVAMDISHGGMFLEGPIPFSVGSLAFLSFDTGVEKISISVQVVRVTSKGVGVRFMGLPQGVADLITSF
jgi:Tfp pilus assembly protein PilZ